MRGKWVLVQRIARKEIRVTLFTLENELEKFILLLVLWLVIHFGVFFFFFFFTNDDFLFNRRRTILTYYYFIKIRTKGRRLITFFLNFCILKIVFSFAICQNFFSVSHNGHVQKDKYAAKFVVGDLISSHIEFLVARYSLFSRFNLFLNFKF